MRPVWRDWVKCACSWCATAASTASRTRSAQSTTWPTGRSPAAAGAEAGACNPLLVKMLSTAQLVAAMSVAAVAAAPAPAAPRLALSRHGAEPGQLVVVAGHGFAERSPVRIALGARTVRRARTGSGGGFRVAFRVPDRPAQLARVKALVRGRSAGRPFRIHRGSEPPTLVAAGDIACAPLLAETATECRQARTAELVERLAPDAVAVLGDAQDDHGELEEFQAVYDPTWGRFKAITYPAPGNHDYQGAPERDAHTRVLRLLRLGRRRPLTGLLPLEARRLDDAGSQLGLDQAHTGRRRRLPPERLLARVLRRGKRPGALAAPPARGTASRLLRARLLAPSPLQLGVRRGASAAPRNRAHVPRAVRARRGAGAGRARAQLRALRPPLTGRAARRARRDPVRGGHRRKRPPQGDRQPADDDGLRTDVSGCSS